MDMDINPKERKRLFSDVNMDKDVKTAKRILYNTYNETTKLNSQITEMDDTLSKLIDSLKRTDMAINSNDATNATEVLRVKQEMDKVAYLIENLVDVFQPMYEKVYSNYTARTLAGDYEKHEVVDWNKIPYPIPHSVNKNNFPIRVPSGQW